MKKHFYSIFDRLCDYGPVFEAPNHSVAMRIFRDCICGGAGVPIDDLDLYHIADFDTETGVISVGESFPVFIVRGASLKEVKDDDDV